MKEPKRFYTYAYLREDGTPYYIGKGNGTRIYQNTGRACIKPKDKSRIIFLKQKLTEDDAFKHEKYMISVFGRKDLGTGILHNRSDGGEGNSGRIVSEETKRKLSEVNRGKGKGRRHSEETKKKLSKIRKGRRISEETKRKLSEAHKGKTHTDETKQKLSKLLSGERHPFYGKFPSEDHRNKIRESKLGKPRSEETKRKISETFKLKSISPSDETRKKISERVKGENNPQYGKKCWNNGIENKFSKECPGDGWVIGLLRDSDKQKWKCTLTGFITDASGLTRYQKNRGIDTSNRIKLS